MPRDLFDDPLRLALGFLTGVGFGFLLQKGRVSRYPVILGQFLLRDWTVLKVMFTAVVVGAVGVYALVGLGAASLHVKAALPAGILIGGVIFAIGIVVLGLCPGTCVAACGEGNRHARFGVLGMLAGAVTYIGLFPAIAPMRRVLGDWGEVTLPQLTGSSPWPWIAGLVLVALVARRLVHRRHAQTRSLAPGVASAHRRSPPERRGRGSLPLDPRSGPGTIRPTPRR